VLQQDDIKKKEVSSLNDVTFSCDTHQLNAAGKITR